ncbi:MAG: hypothetical protein WDN02_11040 [Methylovirgula sp.]|uniref:hypothetical protein n=1 Tax=Methylovirgula sp. TaxID=1978224 RepID=UPI003076109B
MIFVTVRSSKEFRVAAKQIARRDKPDPSSRRLVSKATASRQHDSSSRNESGSLLVPTVDVRSNSARAEPSDDDLYFNVLLAALKTFYLAKIETTSRVKKSADRRAAIQILRDEMNAAMRALLLRREIEKTAKLERGMAERAAIRKLIENNRT